MARDDEERTVKEPIAVNPKWTRGGLVLVCKKCSKDRFVEELPGTAALGKAIGLRSWLKRRLKGGHHAKRIRVVSSGCLDVCPKRAVTVAIEPFARQAPPICLVVDPQTQRELLYERIVATLSPKEEPPR